MSQRSGMRACTVYPHQRHERCLARIFVFTCGFAHFDYITLCVENIVNDLKSEPQIASIRMKRVAQGASDLSEDST